MLSQVEDEDAKEGRWAREARESEEHASRFNSRVIWPNIVCHENCSTILDGLARDDVWAFQGCKLRVLRDAEERTYEQLHEGVLFDERAEAWWTDCLQEDASGKEKIARII